MNIVESLEINTVDNYFQLSLVMKDPISKKNTNTDVANTIADENGVDLKRNTWISIGNNIEMFVDENNASKKLSFRTKQMNLSIIPATCLRLGLVNEEEYTNFNNTLTNHPIIRQQMASLDQTQNQREQDVNKAYAKFLKS